MCRGPIQPQWDNDYLTTTYLHLTSTPVSECNWAKLIVFVSLFFVKSIDYLYCNTLFCAAETQGSICFAIAFCHICVHVCVCVCTQVHDIFITFITHNF